MSSIETGMFFGRPLWQGLGVECSTAPDSATALKMSGLDWTVDPKPITLLGENEPIPNAKANVRSSDGKVLGLVTDRYKVVQNKDAFAFTDELLGGGDIRYETAGSLASGKRVWMLAKMDSTEICGDEIEPYLLFTNSHDGTGSVKVCMTPIRVICQNTLTMALRQASRTWSVRHLGDINSKLVEAQNTLFNANQYLENLKEESEKATEIVIARPEFIAYLNAMFPITEKASERQKANNERAKQTLANIYDSKEDIRKFNGTLYGVINAVADFMPHYQPIRTTKTYQENNMMSIADGGKNDLMQKTCAYFGVGA